jgi:hypothetical protein
MHPYTGTWLSGNVSTLGIKKNLHNTERMDSSISPGNFKLRPYHITAGYELRFSHASVPTKERPFSWLGITREADAILGTLQIKHSSGNGEKGTASHVDFSRTTFSESILGQVDGEQLDNNAHHSSLFMVMAVNEPSKSQNNCIFKEPHLQNLRQQGMTS